MGGDELDELFERWRDSDRQSRTRRSVGRRRGRRRIMPVVLSALIAVSALAVTSTELGEDDVSSKLYAPLAVAGRGGESLAKETAASAQSKLPSARAMRRAWRFARRRGGQVSLAVIDTDGRLRGRDGRRAYVSASVVKSMLLVAELRRLQRAQLQLDPATEDLLHAMITRSDNAAADSIYSRVGDAGLSGVARSARMRGFTVAGYWANAQVTAADLARFFSRLRRLLPRRHRRLGLTLLASVAADQRWGIPRAARGGWRVCFKGGWRATEQGELVHQAARLSTRDRKLAIAILTDAQPSRLYAIHTVRGIADRLLEPRLR